MRERLNWKPLRVSDFHFDLPEELIAQHPPAERGASRMLVLDRRTGEVTDDVFRSLPGLLRPGDLLILNDSRVLPARLFGTRAGLTTQANSPKPSGVIEVLLTEEVEPLMWRALVKPAKKVRVGERLEFYGADVGLRTESPGLKPLAMEADYRGLKPAATPESKPHAAEPGFRLGPEAEASGYQPAATPESGPHVVEPGFRLRPEAEASGYQPAAAPAGDSLGAPVLSAEVVAAGEFGERTLRFEAVEDFYGLVGRIGHMPLPPYIRRDQAGRRGEEANHSDHGGEERSQRERGGYVASATPDWETEDRERYQTVYSRQVGSAAAPTAGLHFTPEVLEELRERGVEVEYVTLHVGLGTFQPVRVAEVKDIRLHEERYTLSQSTAEALNRALAEGRRVIAVGTTTTRTLEHIAARAAEVEANHRDHGGKERTQRRGEAGGDVARGAIAGAIEAHSGATSIFIAPGHRFRVVSGLLTNFHLPESTLLMLVSAFAGEGDEGRRMVLAAYEYAIRAGYRFYSYGDCMLVV